MNSKSKQIYVVKRNLQDPSRELHKFVLYLSKIATHDYIQSSLVDRRSLKVIGVSNDKHPISKDQM